MPARQDATMSYRGRLAPSPTGYLHLGHARTFWIAQERARARHGRLILRNDDLDRARCRPEFVAAMVEDLRWFGLEWSEGPFAQSARRPLYQSAFERLRAGGAIYPCTCSRQEVQRALTAPHLGEEEPIYPGRCRPPTGGVNNEPSKRATLGVNWRFLVRPGQAVVFTDACLGDQRSVAGVDFGDFLVWRRDGFPSYQLACAVDDAAMGITEVVRGADLITSTFRQLLIYRALSWEVPAFYHCPLVTDAHGVRLAKRDGSASLRALRREGRTAEEIREAFF